MGLIALFLMDLLLRSRGLFRGNAARRALRPIIRRLGSTHPRFLARNGDSGRGFDNTTPWYHVYLSVDLTPDLEETVISAARNAGYELHVDQRLINGMPGDLIAENGDRTLAASITRDGEATIYAYGRGVTWGDKRTPPTGKAIVSLNLALPDLR